MDLPLNLKYTGQKCSHGLDHTRDPPGAAAPPAPRPTLLTREAAREEAGLPATAATPGRRAVQCGSGVPADGDACAAASGRGSVGASSRSTAPTAMAPARSTSRARTTCPARGAETQ